jgi:hypothetical protein
MMNGCEFSGDQLLCIGGLNWKETVLRGVMGEGTGDGEACLTLSRVCFAV